MSDKAHEGQKKEGGCCGGTAKTTASNGACSTDKTAQAAQGEKKADKGGCGCA